MNLSHFYISAVFFADIIIIYVRQQLYSLFQCKFKPTRFSWAYGLHRNMSKSICKLSCAKSAKEYDFFYNWWVNIWISFNYMAWVVKFAPIVINDCCTASCPTVLLWFRLEKFKNNFQLNNQLSKYSQMYSIVKSILTRDLKKNFLY